MPSETFETWEEARKWLTFNVDSGELLTRAQVQLDRIAAGSERLAHGLILARENYINVVAVAPPFLHDLEIFTDRAAVAATHGALSDLRHFSVRDEPREPLLVEVASGIASGWSWEATLPEERKLVLDFLDVLMRGGS